LVLFFLRISIILTLAGGKTSMLTEWKRSSLYNERVFRA
jgi:hypothetical protein